MGSLKYRESFSRQEDVKRQAKKKLSAPAVTVIELVMVIVIVGILAGVSSMYIKETIDLWNFLSFRNEVTAQGRMAFERAIREIREIRLRTQSYEPIQAASVNSFRFIAVLDGIDTDITYSLSGGNLLRTTPASSNILASNVSSLQFCYYDSSNQSACSPTAACSCSPVADTTVIYRIVVRMDISSGNQTKHLETQVYPRNL